MQIDILIQIKTKHQWHLVFGTPVGTIVGVLVGKDIGSGVTEALVGDLDGWREGLEVVGSWNDLSSVDQ